MPDHSKIPILVGPTGVGKSEVAYQWALRTKSEIISADAFQVYRGLEVGTAQPSREWQKKVPHHLVGKREPAAPWNAVEFAREAKRILEDAGLKSRKFIVVGGAGFYLKALVEGAPEGNSPTPEIRTMVEAKAGELGKGELFAWLKSRDPIAAERLHPNDLQRVCRALEKSFETTKIPSGFKPLGAKKAVFFGLERSREKLDGILRERSQFMWSGGLLRETQILLDLSLTGDHPLWGAIGFAEAAAHLRGEISEKMALERIFRRTRQYAKRQLTWFKHQHKVEWINLDDFPDILGIVDILEKKLSVE